MLRSGLVSITFRRLSRERIVSLTAEARLAAIEWGGDVHAPPGDAAAARDARDRTRDAGLAVSSYGSYYRAGDDPPEAFEAVLATALELGAPTIRVWAGRRGSADADEASRGLVVEDSLRIAEQAAAEGVGVAFEFHGGTLTDTNESAAQLLAEAPHTNLGCYWQPPRAASAEDCLTGIDALGDRLSNVHVFSWAADGVRLPLAEGEASWRRYLSRIDQIAGDRYALLEFVREDSPDAFLRDAETLKRWLDETAR